MSDIWKPCNTVLHTLAALVVCAIGLPTAQAQFVQQGSKLVGTGAAGNAEQGVSVALSADGNTAIVGGLNDNFGIGAAWVYTRSAGVWSQQGGKLIGTGAVGPAQQGRSVTLSADGNTAVVGGLYDYGGVGAAWVYTRSAGVWSQQGSKLVGTGATDGYSGAQQGYSVAVSADGNTAMVGGNRDAGNTGAAWVFTRSGGVWSQQGGKLVGSGGVGSPEQGYSVALSADGNTAIVGGPFDNGAYAIGAAWIYTRSGGVWSQQGAKLVGTRDVGSFPFQGDSVAYRRTGIRPSWVDLMTTAITTAISEPLGFILARAACGASKAANWSGRMRRRAHVRAGWRYRRTGIGPSLADSMTTVTSELRGFTHARAAYGASKAPSWSARVLWGAHIKASWRCPQTGIRPWWAAPTTTAMPERRGCL